MKLLGLIDKDCSACPSKDDLAYFKMNLHSNSKGLFGLMELLQWCGLN